MSSKFEAGVMHWDIPGVEWDVPGKYEVGWDIPGNYEEGWDIPDIVKGLWDIPWGDLMLLGCPRSENQVGKPIEWDVPCKIRFSWEVPGEIGMSQVVYVLKWDVPGWLSRVLGHPKEYIVRVGCPSIEWDVPGLEWDVPGLEWDVPARNGMSQALSGMSHHVSGCLSIYQKFDTTKKLVTLECNVFTFGKSNIAFWFLVFVFCSG
ncbi:hypothetical protein B0H11DRAFT_1899677 [Mycena galericulata]|nr:hypothetical protein B0H11DRAFT_1917787 [Mycena galericulata]KAJ7511215.1 hypothetical protein B0H11DRAFT_1899677 [Mycena galericulata]